MKNIFFLLTMLFLSPALFAQESLNVELLDNWNNPDYPPNGSGDKYNETWGFVHEGEEYGVIGSVEGISIFRITEDDQLEFIQFIEGAETQGVVHRDYHDYAGYLYAVCDQGASTLQIMDLSYLPDSVEVVYDSNDLITRTHNIFIDTATAKMYACGHISSMTVFSLEDPTAPDFLYIHNRYVHDAYVRNDTAFLNSGEDGLFIYDFSDMENPLLLGNIEFYEDKGYNHSGWLSEDGNTYVFADELPNGMRMKVCDVSNLPNIEIISFFHADMDDDPFSTPHNLMIRNNHVYVSHYIDGLQIFDISDTENPVKAGYYETYPHEIDPDDHEWVEHFNGAWGVYALLPSGRILVSDMTYGLFLLKFSDIFTTVENHHEPNGIKVFPNPASEYVELEFEENESFQDKYLYVFNMNGQLVHEQHVQDKRTRVNVQSYNSGAYFYSIFDRQSQQTKSGKFIVH